MTQSALSGLPLIAAGALPADVRAAGTGAQQEYRTALSFERVLLARLTQSLQSTATPTADDDSTGDDGGGDSSGLSAAGGAYRDMLPGVMADALTANGGIGIARSLYDASRPAQ